MNNTPEILHKIDTKDGQKVDVQQVMDEFNLKEQAGISMAKNRNMIPETFQRPTTSRWELWSYYAYYAGNSGLGPFNYSSSQYQDLLYMAATCDDNDNCTLPWAGGQKSVTSIVLDVSGIQFAVQVVLLIFVGSVADYVSWRRYLVVACTVIGFAFSMAWLGLTEGSQWRIAIAVQIISLIMYNLALTYYGVVMPGLVRDLPEQKKKEKDVIDGVGDPIEYAQSDMITRNRVANYSYAAGSLPPVAFMAIAIPIVRSLNYNDSETANIKAYGVINAYTAAWMLLCVPWFFFEQRRPVTALPKGTTYWNVGWRSLYDGSKLLWKLKQTLLYLIANILLSDSINTASTLIFNLQYEIASFDLDLINRWTTMSYATQFCGIAMLWGIQRYFKFHTKTILMVDAGLCMCAIIWGFIGIWTTNFGYKNIWEIWVWQAWFGFAICPFTQLNATMISDVVPRPKLALFWSVFTIFGRASSFVGPFVTSAIIDDAGGNQNMGFAFLLPMMILGMVCMYFVDPDKSQLECEAFIAAEAAANYEAENGSEKQEKMSEADSESA